MSKKKQHHPPRFGERLFRLILPESEKKALLGDYEELYQDVVQRRGRIIADLWYCMQMIITIPSAIWDSAKWSMIMIRNYLKIAFRNIFEHRGYSFIKIAGLAVGLACCLLIVVYIQYELSFDRFNKNADRIFKLYSWNSENNCYPLTQAIRNEIPSVENATHLNDNDDVIIRAGDNWFWEKRWLWADKNFFTIFTLPFIHGNPETALENPYSLVIDEETAHKYFGKENPVGKIIIGFPDSDNENNYQITGVIENIPKNSHIQGHLFASIETYRSMGIDMNDWNSNWVFTYVILKEGADSSELQENINAIFSRNTNRQNAITLRKLTGVHLRSGEIRNSLGPQGNIEYVYLLSAIAFIILLIACINYVNLSTAGSMRRSKEIGIRKTAGAFRLQLIRQFLGESLLVTLIAIVIAVAFAAFFLERFAQFADRDIPSNALFNFKFLVALFGIGIFTGVLSGGYPAIHMSRFKPVIALKGAYSKSTKGTFLRNLLVIFQFSLSVFFIVSALIISSQLHLIQSKKLGFDREHIIVIDVQYNKEVNQNFPILKNELLRNTHIAGVTSTTTIPMNIDWSTEIYYEGQPDDGRIYGRFAYVDFDYINLFGLELIAGRNFSPEMKSDRTGGGAYILNETAVEQIGWDDPIGKKLRFSYNEEMGTVIGVIKNFHNRPLHYAQEPVALQLNSNSNIKLRHKIRMISIKIRPENIQETIKEIEKVWKKFSGGWPLEYKFMDDEYDKMYKSEIQLGTLFRFLSILAISISCLGLFGLSLFKTEQRTKEIGIRKVLGASVPSIVKLLSKDFTKCVLVANILSWPIAYYVMIKWLQNFAYRASLNIWIFILSGLAALIIALLTVSYQTIKAATANPIDSLRYE